MLNEKFLKIKKDITYFQKEKKGEAKYSFVSSSDVVHPIREKMCELGLLLIPNIKDHVMTKIFESDKSTTILTELAIDYTWVDTEDNDTLKISWYAQGVDISGEKGVGKALTYAEKYFLLKFFNIPTDNEDPDTFANKKSKSKRKTNDETTDNYINYEQKSVLRKNIGDLKYNQVMAQHNGKLLESEYHKLLEESAGW